MLEAGFEGVAMVAVVGPDVNVHSPVPTAGVLPDRVTLLRQALPLDGADGVTAAVLTAAPCVIEILELVEQGALGTLQMNVLVPAVNPVTVLLFSVRDVTVAPPSVTLQTPCRGVGSTAARVAPARHVPNPAPALDAVT